MNDKENSSSEATVDETPENIDSDAGVEKSADGADASELDQLRAELAHAQDEAAAARDDLLRARAEVENIRKRAERDIASAHKYGQERFVGALLPVKDSLDLGFDALDSASDLEAIREGMTLTAKMFDDALEKAGVVAIDPVGEPFDPEFHQAMTMQETSDADPGTVISVMQKGYQLNERLIRPAMVIVAKAPGAE